MKEDNEEVVLDARRRSSETGQYLYEFLRASVHVQERR